MLELKSMMPQFHWNMLLMLVGLVGVRLGDADGDGSAASAGEPNSEAMGPPAEPPAEPESLVHLPVLTSKKPTTLLPPAAAITSSLPPGVSLGMGVVSVYR